MPIRKSEEEYITQAKAIYGDEYTFESLNYINNRTKISPTCKIHGTFYRNPLMFLRGYGCPYCSDKKHFYTYEEYCNLLKEKYGDVYTITEEDFCNKDKQQYVVFQCKKHGRFKAKLTLQLQNTCCKECKKEIKNTEINKKVQQQYGNNYTAYYNVKDNRKIDIKCLKHNVVTSVWKAHLFKNKFICNECYKEYQLQLNKEQFLDNANEIYKGFYSYIGDYTNSQAITTAICPIHGEFKVTPNDHLNKHSGCPKCSNKQSNGEDEVYGFCKELCSDTIQRDKTVITPYEMDVFVPSKNLAIEYNGLTWHSEQHKDNAKKYHIHKSNLCTEKGVRLLHIFEDEWLEHSDKIKSIIREALCKMENKINVEDCQIKSIPSNEAMQFLEDNYIKGKHRSSYRYGLYYKDELVLLTTFIKRGEAYHLQCFCNKLNTSVVDGENLLLQHFINEVKPKRIITYADKRFSDGSEFYRLGFVKFGDTDPNYYYCNRQQREDKTKYTKKELVKQGFDKDKTEHQIMLERGIYRIYDCGQAIFELLLNS